jgi:agmatinase
VRMSVCITLLRIWDWMIDSVLVEVAPVYDNAGQTTVLAAAEVALSLIRLMVKTPVASLK